MRIMTRNVQGRVGQRADRRAALRSGIEQIGPDVPTLQETCPDSDGTQAARRYPEAPYWVVNAVLADSNTRPGETPRWRHS